jgi:hypothetical protein
MPDVSLIARGQRSSKSISIVPVDRLFTFYSTVRRRRCRTIEVHLKFTPSYDKPWFPAVPKPWFSSVCGPEVVVPCSTPPVRQLHHSIRYQIRA